VNIQKAAAALTNVADALYELSEALTEQPAAAGTSAGVASGVVSSPGTAPDGLPPVPPIEEVLYADELQEEQAKAPIVYAGSATTCPKHKVAYRPSKKPGGQPYCPKKDDEPKWSYNGWCAINPKTAIAWIKQHAAVPA